MALPTRAYLVINSNALTDTVVRFRTPAPAGSVGTVLVDGRRERVVLHDYQMVDGHGLAYAAEFLDAYL
ncbi:hypothetical protein ABZ599_16525 [Streptomyces misionensis]|uniref:hypothetical protein n=1 Tax=Streptomyces misionensis TaxID=67331 RepID=UPI0033D23E40